MVSGKIGLATHSLTHSKRDTHMYAAVWIYNMGRHIITVGHISLMVHGKAYVELWGTGVPHRDRGGGRG